MGERRQAANRVMRAADDVIERFDVNKWRYLDASGRWWSMDIPAVRQLLHDAVELKRIVLDLEAARCP